MDNQTKYPEIWAAKETAEAELSGLMADREIHTDAIADIQLQIAPLNAEKLRLNSLAMADIDRIKELKDEIARFAHAMGGISAGG